MITNNFRDLLYIAIANETLICDNEVFYGTKIKYGYMMAPIKKKKIKLVISFFVENQINDFIN
jgi:hypothetical protein